MRFLLALCLFGCSEYGVHPNNEEPTAPDGPQDLAPVDDACALAEPAPYAVSQNESCVGEARVMNFEPVQEWNWGSNPVHPGYHMVMMTPVVGDLNGDGDPDIVFVAYKGDNYWGPGALTAISGKDGTTLFSYLGLDGATIGGSTGVAIADTDGDGTMTIFVATDRGLASVEFNGDVNWFAPAGAPGHTNPAIADVDGDGTPEIIFERSVVNLDGSVRWTGTSGHANGSSFPVDLDRDGFQEIVAGNTVYNHDGSVRWSISVQESYPAVADMTGDGEPEIVAVSLHGLINIWDADGVLLRQSDQTLSFRGGPPTIADYDGDGEPEIGIAGKNSYRVFNTDLTLLWQQSTEDDSSSVTGSSVFDFEGDGAAEVVYADEHTLYIYDGATGAIEMRWDNHASGTLVEYPVIADIDGDNSAEIVVPSNNMWWSGNTGITVIGDAEEGWAPARALWNQHAYSVTNILDDGTIPAIPEPNWDSYNTFRAGNTETPASLDRPDLHLGPPDFCTDACDDGRLVVYIPLENSGLVAAHIVDIAVYSAQGELIDTMSTTVVDIDENTWLGPLDVATDLIPPDGLVLSIDDDGSGFGHHEECDEDNNQWVVASNPCLDSGTL